MYLLQAGQETFDCLQTIFNTYSIADSCSSTFGGRKEKRTIEPETLASPKAVTFLPTTTNYTIMTEPETTTPIDKTLKQDQKYQHIELCEGLYEAEYCLNGGTCYTHKYPGGQVYVCECSSHYHGVRCEEKSLEGSYGGGMKLRVRRINRRSVRRRISRMFNFVCLVSVLMVTVSSFCQLFVCQQSSVLC